MKCEQEKTTALIQAAYKGQLEACKLLVERGANLNIQDKVRDVTWLWDDIDIDL
jgi:ankyrin repeat protein